MVHAFLQQIVFICKVRTYKVIKNILQLVNPCYRLSKDVKFKCMNFFFLTWLLNKSCKYAGHITFHTPLCKWLSASCSSSSFVKNFFFFFQSSKMVAAHSDWPVTKLTSNFYELCTIIQKKICSDKYLPSE